VSLRRTSRVWFRFCTASADKLNGTLSPLAMTTLQRNRRSFRACFLCQAHLALSPWIPSACKHS
jgi:hypothetical protein